MKKMMLVGAVGTGKTTLTQRLQGHDIYYLKTQAIEYEEHFIDTPGEFSQRRNYYSALQVTSNQADVIGMLQSVTDTFGTYPPGFSTMFSKPIIGIVTKIDLAQSDLEIAQAVKALKLAGARDIFKISATKNQGIEALVTFLKN